VTRISCLAPCLFQDEGFCTLEQIKIREQTCHADCASFVHRDLRMTGFQTEAEAYETLETNDHLYHSQTGPGPEVPFWV